MKTPLNTSFAAQRSSYFFCTASRNLCARSTLATAHAATHQENHHHTQKKKKLQNWGGAPRRGTRGGGELGDEALAQDLEPVLGLLLQLAEERLRVVLAQPVDHVVGPFEGDAEPFLVLVVGLDLGVDLPHHVAQLVPALPPLGIGLGRLLPMSSRTTRHEEVRREDEQSK